MPFYPGKSLTLALGLCLVGVESAYAHLVAGRRPLDYFVRNADAVLIAEVHSDTTGRQQGHRTVFLPITCLNGNCPQRSFEATPFDDHVAEFTTGERVFLALSYATDRKNSSQWLVLQNAWEAGTLGPRYAERAAFYAPKYAALEGLAASERETAYLGLLLEQVGDELPTVQDDALQSLLRFPGGKAGPEATRQLLEVAANATREAQQIALLAIAQSWNEKLVLERIQDGQFLSSRWPGGRARAVALLGKGDATDRIKACAHLNDGDARVRSAAVTQCSMPDGGHWPLLYRIIQNDSATAVRDRSRERFGASESGRDRLRKLVLAELPPWRRWFYSATGKEPPGVKKILTD